MTWLVKLLYVGQLQLTGKAPSTLRKAIPVKNTNRLFIAVLFASCGLAQGGPVFPVARYYYVERNAGSVLWVTYVEPEGIQSLWAEGSSTPIIYEGPIGVQESPLPSGTLYLWLTESEVGGTYAGWAAVDQFYANGSTPGVHLPIKGSTIQFVLKQEDFPQAMGRTYCVVYPKIVDEMERPSLWSDWPHVSENGTRPISVEVE